jgi:hypothetical protein
MLFSRAMRRTSGELRTFSAEGADGLGGAPGLAGAVVGALFEAAAAAGFAASGFAGAGAGAAAVAEPAASIVATIVCTGTVCPALTLISFKTPAAGAGISASTLSVEISNSGSSRSIFSPGFFNHFVIVPS